MGLTVDGDLVFLRKVHEALNAPRGEDLPDQLILQVVQVLFLGDASAKAVAYVVEALGSVRDPVDGHLTNVQPIVGIDHS